MSIPQEELDTIPKIEELYNSNHKEKIKIKKFIERTGNLV